MIPAVAYYRMSSDRQEASITDQRKAVQAFAAANGYVLLREYCDEAISGWRDDRKAFQQLIADAPAGRFQAVLCWDQDRFSRFPVLEANHYWFILDKAGIQLHTVAQGKLDFSTLAGWLTASIAQHGKSEYCRDLARNTTRGLRKRKFAGEWVGKAPFGYRIGEHGKLELGDPEQIEAVRLIFRLRAEGLGYIAICRRLAAAGVKTPRGHDWSQFTVKHILQRDAYLGTVVIGKWSRAKYEKLSDKPMQIDDAHPAIISRKEWDAARATDQRNQVAHTQGDGEGSALGGLVYCGECGYGLYARRFLGVPPFANYVCGQYSRSGGCKCCTVRQDEIHAAVFAAIRKSFGLAELAKLERIVARKLADKPKDAINHADLERQIAAIDRKLSNAAERLVSVNASLVASVESKMLELQRQRAELEAKMLVKETPSATAGEVLAELTSLRDALDHGSPSVVRNALSRVVSRIVVNFSSVPYGSKQRWRATDATIFTEGYQHSGRISLLVKAALELPGRIQISQRDLRAARNELA